MNAIPDFTVLKPGDKVLVKCIEHEVNEIVTVGAVIDANEFDAVSLGRLRRTGNWDFYSLKGFRQVAYEEIGQGCNYWKSSLRYKVHRDKKLGYSDKNTLYFLEETVNARPKSTTYDFFNTPHSEWKKR